jgi:hypothetical protein
MGSSFESGESTPQSSVCSTARKIRRTVRGESFSESRDALHGSLLRRHLPGSLRSVSGNWRNVALHHFAVVSTWGNVAFP